MTGNFFFPWAITFIVSCFGWACEEKEEPGAEFSDYTELDIAVCAPGTGTFSLDIDNQFFPLEVGRKLTLEGEDDGEALKVEITVLDETEEVAGVVTRVVEEAEWEGGELVEVSRNFFAQAPDGTVCYFGEEVDIYEEGEVKSHEGAWRAGEDGAQPGIMMPGTPEPGTKFAQEKSPGVAEDMSAITDINQTIEVPTGKFQGAVRTVDWNPLDSGEDEKFYAKGIGLVVDEEVKLTSHTSGSSTEPDSTTSL